MTDSEQSEWAEEAPKVPGWYWMKDKEKEPIVMNVFIRPGHKYLAVFGGTYQTEYIPITYFIAKWAGPIEPPNTEGE